jgi:hypothetical protein
MFAKTVDLTACEAISVAAKTLTQIYSQLLTTYRANVKPIIIWCKTL